MENLKFVYLKVSFLQLVDFYSEVNLLWINKINLQYVCSYIAAKYYFHQYVIDIDKFLDI